MDGLKEKKLFVLLFFCLYSVFGSKPKPFIKLTYHNKHGGKEMKEKGQGILEYLLLVGGAICIAAIVIFCLASISNTINSEAFDFCKEKGFEYGEKKTNPYPNEEQFYFECSNIIKEKHCIEDYCKTIDKEEIKRFYSTKSNEKECETKCLI